jgi:hypothetical protein
VDACIAFADDLREHSVAIHRVWSSENGWPPNAGTSAGRVRFDDRGIIALRLVDPRGYGPHPHRFRREQPHEVVRIGLITVLASPAIWCEPLSQIRARSDPNRWGA